MQALLASCDRTRRTGRRDFTILVLLSRLGLRAAEVAALRLEDLDWRAGEVVVHGKGDRGERLQLLGDVGAAMADYLRHARPPSDSRAVFLQAQTPPGAMTPNAVLYVPRAASRRAVTVTAALAWASARDASPQLTSRRLSIIRRFAGYLTVFDDTTQVPPLVLVRAPIGRTTPYLYSIDEVRALMAAARFLQPELRGATNATPVGLMAATGPRTGEAVALGRGAPAH